MTAASPRLNSVLEGRAYLHRVMVVLPRHWRTHLQDQDIEEGAGLAARRPDVLVVDSGQICKRCSSTSVPIFHTQLSCISCFQMDMRWRSVWPHL